MGEEYNITNKTTPPLAFYKADGSFLFSLPEGAAMNQVSAVSSAGMPVIQTTIDKGKNKEQSDRLRLPPRRKRRTDVLQTAPIADNQARPMTFTSPYAADRVGIFVPPSVQVSGTGLRRRR